LPENHLRFLPKIFLLRGPGRVRRGSGIGGQREGLLYQNVLATYTHLHALGSPQWAAGMVRRAREHRQVSRPLEKVAAEDHDSPQEARL